MDGSSDSCVHHGLSIGLLGFYTEGEGEEDAWNPPSLRV